MSNAHEEKHWPGTPHHTHTMDAALRALWLKLAPMPQDLRLYDGTALALYTGHRQSPDLDFATPHGCVDRKMARTLTGADEEMQFATPTGTVTVSETARMRTLRPLGPAVIRGGDGMVDVVVRTQRAITISMMECGAVIPHPLHRPRAAPNGVLVAHPVDLVAAKLHAIMTRDAERDFIDLDAAQRHWPGIITPGLETAMDSAKYSAGAIARTLVDPPYQSAFRLDPEARARLAQAGQEAEAAVAQAHGPGQGDGTMNEAINYDPRPDVTAWHGTPIPPVAAPLAQTPRRTEIAEEVWWHGPAWTVLRNRGEFIRRVMEYASSEDAAEMRTDLGDEHWREALRDAQPRTMSRKAYVWWSVKLGLMKPGEQCDWPYDGHANDIQPLAAQSRERLYARHAMYHQRRQAHAAAGSR